MVGELRSSMPKGVAKERDRKKERKREKDRERQGKRETEERERKKESPFSSVKLCSSFPSLDKGESGSKLPAEKERVSHYSREPETTILCPIPQSEAAL